MEKIYVNVPYGFLNRDLFDLFKDLRITSEFIYFLRFVGLGDEEKQNTNVLP